MAETASDVLRSGTGRCRIIRRDHLEAAAYKLLGRSQSSDVGKRVVEHLEDASAAEVSAGTVAWTRLLLLTPPTTERVTLVSLQEGTAIPPHPHVPPTPEGSNVLPLAWVGTIV